MAVVLVEGFDHYADAQATEKFWSGAIFSMVPGRGFTGGQAINVIINNQVRKVLPSTYGTLIFGAAIKVDDTAAGAFMSLNVGGTNKVSVSISGTQKLLILDSTGSIVGTGTTTVPLSSWFYVELKCVKGASGTATLHLNGAAEIAASTGNYGTSNFDTVEFANHSLSGNTKVDDVFVLDTTGSGPQNDFVGDVRVVTLYPVADGSYTQWTPDTGTDHFSRVDELLIDGDASYVKDATPGDKDSYLMDTFLTTIYSAQFNLGARKGESALRQIAPLIRQAGTDHVGATFTLSLDYLFYSWILDNDPTGSPWLAATINADEFGQELIT